MNDYSFKPNVPPHLDDTTDGEDAQDTLDRMRYEQKHKTIKVSDQSAVKKKSNAPTNTTDQFTEPNQNLQVRLPRDLVKSLKLQAMKEERSISLVVLDLLTTQNVAQRRHISLSRKQDVA